MNIGRTNVYDNTELQLKYKAIQVKHHTFPLLVSLQGGAAYNAQVNQTVADNGKKYQFYGQVIANTVINKKLGFGIVPTYLHNAHIFCKESRYSFTLGNYMQYYITPRWSVFFEWNPTVTGWRRTFNSASLGFELETGGHFFKILFTNNDKVTSAQYISGADLDFLEGDWRLGFMITRLIK